MSSPQTLALLLGSLLVFFLGIIAGLGLAVRVLRWADPTLDASVERLIAEKRKGAPRG